MSDFIKHIFTMDAAGEASTDTFMIGTSGNMFVCADCRKTYKTERGLTLHMQKKHAEVYHELNIPQPRVKARWDDEEYVLLAREEVRLARLGVKFMNKELRKVLPHHSLESIKGVRRTNNTKYQNVLREFREKPEVPPSPPECEERARCGAPLIRENFPEVGVSADKASCDEHLDTWWAKIKFTIQDYSFLGGLDADLLTRDVLTDEVRQAIDLDFRLWVDSITARKLAGVVPPRRQNRRNRRNRRESTEHAGAAHVVPNGSGMGRDRIGKPHRKSARNERKAAYKKVQQLFKRKRARCAREVLDGSWEKPIPRLSLEELEPFWRGVFETESVVDERDPDPIGPVLWNIVEPITLDELQLTIKAMKAGAPGPDGMVLSQLKKLPLMELILCLNLWLMAGFCPDVCCMGESVLIPKDRSDIRPPKHRQITMANMIVRCFHKLLAKRMGESMPFSDRQKAFRSGDGLAENVVLLRAVIEHHKKNNLLLNVVFLDIAKAFDSVSHDSILIAARRMGIPPPFLTYLKEYYSRSQTCIRVSGQKSEPIRVRRGVKQGDPMSVHLFNAVIDWALSTLDPHLCIEIGGVRLSHLAFADDIGLLTRTSVGAQSQINRLNDHLKKCGLSISAGISGKSASMRIDVDGKKKKWVVNPNVHLHVAGEDIPAITVTQVYSYLGIPFSPKGPIVDVASKLQTKLDNLSRAPLKPQQRLYILRRHVLPATYHQLALTNCPKKLLNFIDLKIRGAVRRWLK